MGVRGIGRWLLGESPWLVVHAPHFVSLQQGWAGGNLSAELLGWGQIIVRVKDQSTLLYLTLLIKYAYFRVLLLYAKSLVSFNFKMERVINKEASFYQIKIIIMSCMWDNNNVMCEMMLIINSRSNDPVDLPSHRIRGQSPLFSVTSIIASCI